MIEKGYLNIEEYQGVEEKDKIEYLNKIHYENMDAVSIIFDKSAPEIVQQAYFFLNRVKTKGIETAIKGFYKIKGYSLVSKEYVKFDNENWVLFLKTVGEFSENSTERALSFALGRHKDEIYLALEGSNKVFLIDKDFSLTSGFIKVNEIKEYMDSLPNKDPYRVSDIEEAMFIIDAPSELFAKDAVYYRDGNNMGVWISFGTFLRFDITDINNFTISGTPIALVDSKLSLKHKIKKILNAKAAKYGSILMDKEKFLQYAMKEAKNYLINKNKISETRYCLENLIQNLEDKGLLGIHYETIETISNMYMPVYDYAQNKVEDIVGNAICFIYEDEYLYMNLDMKNKCINFNTYKGPIYKFADKNFSLEIRNEPFLSKRNYIVDGQVTFTGFDNLVENEVVDIYFNDKTTILENNNQSFAVDITSFKDYYSEQIKNTNTSFFKDGEILKVYGSNKYPYTTGLLHYQEKKDQYQQNYYELKMSTGFGYKSIIDAQRQTAYINKLVMFNYSFIEKNTFKPQFSTIKTLVNKLKNKSNKNNKQNSPFNTAGLWFVEYIYRYTNGWITFKDSYRDEVLTLFTDRDIYYDFVVEKFFEMVLKRIESMKKANIKIDDSKIKQIGLEVLTKCNLLDEFITSSMDKFLVNKVKVSYDKGFVFKSVGNDLYVNNKPNNEICNHAVINYANLRERMFDRMIKEMSGDFLSPYIEEAFFSKKDNTFVLNIKRDLSSKEKVIIFETAGIMIKAPEAKENELYSFKPRLLIDYLGKKEIKGVESDIYFLATGLVLKIDDSKIQSHVEKELQNQLAQDQANKQLLRELMEKVKRSSADAGRAINFDNVKIKVPDNFIPFGVPLMVAYNKGRILVSVDGGSWYEPYSTPNGIKLNGETYIIDVDLFGLMLDSMRISDMKVISNDKFIEAEVEFIDLKEVRLHKIRWNDKGAYVKFEFVNIYAVIDGHLFKPGEIIERHFEFDIIQKKIINGIEYGFVNIPIVYYTIFPVEGDVEYSSAEEILNHPNCFRVEHNVPISYKIGKSEYFYESKEDAIDDGVNMFIDFTQKADDE